MTEIFLKLILLPGVTRRVSSSTFVQRGCSLRRVVWVGLALLALPASAVTEVPGPVYNRVESSANAAETAKEALDELVFRDGDRVRGRFVERAGDTLVFKSERFGLLRVPAADAEVTLAQPPAPAVAGQVAKGEEEKVAFELWPFSPVALAQALKNVFGSWHGRFSVAAEVLQDAKDHNNVMAEARLQRKWKRDEVQMSGRYDYASIDEVPSTDMVKADGVWRHDFPNRLFGIYRPSLEWNRAYYRNGLPSDYVLLQQEAGAGVNLFDRDTRKLRVGVSENFFDVWVTPTQSHTAQTVESLFAEFEAKLPWRISLTNRGVWYYSIRTHDEGWENRFEISKKLTETLTVGARHETRHNNPDVRAADYERLRVLFGFDF
jgi:hypothetical protein